MTIISSTFAAGHAQIDGRRYVTNTHTDHLGVQHKREYLASVGADHAVIAAAQGPQVEAELAEAEAAALLA